MNPDPDAFARRVAEATACGLVAWRKEAPGLWAACRGDRRLAFSVSTASVTLTADGGGAALGVHPDGAVFELHSAIMRSASETDCFFGACPYLVKRGIHSVDEALAFIAARSDAGRVRWKSSPNTLSASVCAGLHRLRVEILYQGGGCHPEPLSLVLHAGGADFERRATIRDCAAARLAESAAKSAFGGLYVPPREGGRP